jgi:hypothetical protein
MSHFVYSYNGFRHEPNTCIKIVHRKREFKGIDVGMSLNESTIIMHFIPVGGMLVTQNGLKAH